MEKSEITGFTRVISPLKVNIEAQLKKTPTIINCESVKKHHEIDKENYASSSINSRRR